MKKLFILLSFIVALNTYSALVFADNDYYDADDGYRYSQPRSDYYQQNNHYYPQSQGQHYYPQPQVNYYNGSAQPYYYSPQRQNWRYYDQRSRQGLLRRCYHGRYRY